MLNNDSEIIVSKSKNIMDIINANNNTLQLNDISTNINEYISVSGGSGGGDEKQSKLIQASSIKNKCGASGSCADSNTKTCCDSFKNIYNKLTSCFVASGNINEYDEYTYAPVPEINDSELTSQVQEELTMVIKDSKIRIQKELEEFSKKMMEDTQRSIQNEFAKYYKIDESSSTTRTCYDFFKNTFNKLKSYVMPSPNNKNTDSQVDEEENSLML